MTLSARDRQLAHAAGLSTPDDFALESVSPAQTILWNFTQPRVASASGSSSTWISWSYVGYTQKSIVVDHIRFVQLAPLVSGGAISGQLALASTPAAPDGSNKQFTILAVAGDLPDLTAGDATNGILRQNITPLGKTIAPCVHLWVGSRFVNAGSQFWHLGMRRDLEIGALCSTSNYPQALAVGAVINGTAALIGITASPAGMFTSLIVRP